MDTWACFFFSEELWDPTWARNVPADPIPRGDVDTDEHRGAVPELHDVGSYGNMDLVSGQGGVSSQGKESLANFEGSRMSPTSKTWITIPAF